MSTRTRWLACLLLGALFLTPVTGKAQDMNFGPPSWQFPLPLVWNGDQTEGFYGAVEGMFIRMNNPLASQVIAVRGVFDDSGLIDGQGTPFAVITPPLPSGPFNGPNGALVITGFGTANALLTAQQGRPGQFLGSKVQALNTNMLDEDEFQPGWRLTFGYRLRNGIAVEFAYWQLQEFRNIAGTGVLPAGSVGFAPGSVGRDLADTFVSVPFYNFGPLFGGPSRDVVSNVVLGFIQRDPSAPNSGLLILSRPLTPQETADLASLGGIARPAYGIWNGAEDIQAEFKSMIWNAELNARLPITQTECTRTTMLVGARYMNLWERFRMRTVDQDVDGNTDPTNTAYYNNQWQNYLWGAQLGMSHESYIGQGFAWSVEGRAGLFLDWRNTKVGVVRGDEETVAVTVVRNDASLSPMVSAAAYLWWYPLEGVQLRVGYEFTGVFNVLRSPRPVAFDVGHLDPEYRSMMLRLDGFTAGIAFSF